MIAASLVVAVALGGGVLLGNGDRALVQPHAGDPPTVPARAMDAGQVLFRVAHDLAPGPAAADGSVPVAVSRQAALSAGRTGTMVVELPDGIRYPVRYERSESAPDGNWTFVGRVDTRLGALASVITFGRDGVFGTLPAPDGEMIKLTTRGGQVFLQPAGFVVPPGVDPSRYPDYIGSEVAAPAMPAAAAAPSTPAAPGAPAMIGQEADADDEVTITILAVYTKNLSQLRGSRAAAETEYRNLVAVMNQAHIDSRTVARFEIAAFVETIYPANASIAEARDDIEGILPDGTNLAALRDQHEADLVAMIRPYVPHDLYCGISQFPGQPLQWFLDASTGYSVTAVGACAPIVFAHEIGHNLGLMHDRDTVAGPHGSTLRYGTYPFSFGHRQLGPPGFATIMAYESESRPRLDYFSHPGTTLCGGGPCGDAALADNARAVNLSAESISRFRTPPGVMWINDQRAYEFSSDLGAYVTVELSSPAPAGGVTFDIVVEEGTAQRSVDVDVVDENGLTDMSIPQGHTYATFDVLVRADDLPESSETMRFHLRNVRGDVVVQDDDATLTIVDYDTPVPLEGNVRFPVGLDDKPGYANVLVVSYNEGFRDERLLYASAPDYRYQTEVEEGSLVEIKAYPHAGGFGMRDVVLDAVDRPMFDIDLRLEKRVRLSGRVLGESGQPVTGVPVLLWNPEGDGSGFYANWLSGGYVAPYDRDVLPGTAMQLEIRDPPAPYVRQVVEVPPMWAAGARDIRLRRVPSLTIPHVTVTEGAAAGGPRTILVTASLSVPGTETGVSFDIQRHGTAGANDVQLPQTRFTIAKGRSRVDVPIVIVGDDTREEDETIELRITNIQGAAWNPGPGSVRIATDDGHPGDGSCKGSTADGAVRMCQ